MLISAITLCGLLFVGYVMLAVLLRIIRRGSRARQKPPEEDYDWTFSELQRLHDAGQLSDDEFHRAREVILANARLRSTSDDGPQKGFDVLPRKPD